MEQTILNCNKQAMDSLRTENFEEAHQLLNQAEQLLKANDFDTRKKLLAVTYNNQGCFYKRVGELDLALEYLKEALELEEEGATEITNRAGTLLNICAIMSQTDRHEEALQCALKALRLLKKQSDDSPNGVTTLVIAYHNTGVELEFLNQRQEAALTFKQGWDLARERLGLKHSLTSSLKVSYMQATEGALDSLVRPNFSSRGRILISSIGNSKQISPKTSGKGYKRGPHSLPPSSNLALPNISRGQRREKPSQRNMQDRSFPPWVDPSKLSPEEISWYKQADLDRKLAPPAKIAEQLMNGNVRFISGVRKQPMHKELTDFSSISKMKPQKASPKSQKKPLKPKAPNSLKKIAHAGSSRSIEPKRKNKGKSKGKIPALTHKIDHISDQLNGLQQKLQDFEGKYQQLKDVSKTPDSFTNLSSYQNSRGSDAAAILAKKEASRKLERELRLHVLSIHWLRLQALPKKPKKASDATRSPARNLFVDRPLATIPESSEVAENRQERAVVIQSYVRMFLARRRFLKKKDAAVVLQKNVRKWQTNKLYKNIRLAVIFIQSVFKGYRVRRGLR